MAVSSGRSCFLLSVNGSFDGFDERGAFADDVSRQLGGFAFTNVPGEVCHSRRSEQRLASLQDDRRLPLELVLQRTFQDKCDFYAWMLVVDRGRTWIKVDPRLDDLLPSNCDILLQKVDALDFLLRLGRL